MPRLRLVLIFCLSLLLAACTLAGDPIPAGPIQTGPLPGEPGLAPETLPHAASGAALFAQHCAACHGATGKGDGEKAGAITAQGLTLPDFSDPTLAQDRSAALWFSIITTGNIQNLMPPFSDTLSESERWDVAYYLYSLSTPPAVLERGQQVYTETCAKCHGADGSQDKLNDLAALSALSPSQIVDQYVVSGKDGVHVFDLPAADQQAVALFARTFTYDARLPAVEVAPTPPLEATAEPAPDSSGAGVVAGKLTNGTPGAAVPAGLEVQIKGAQTDAQGALSEFLTRTVPLAADGSYRFDALPFDKANSAYLVTVVYDGVEYRSGALVKDAANLALDLPITIYEATTDPSVISLDALRLAIQPNGDTLSIIQVMIFSNSSDHVFVTADPVAGGRRGSVSFRVPPAAYNIQFEQGSIGGRYVAADGRIYDTQYVLPGQQSHTIALAYLLPYKGDIGLPLPLDYQAGLVAVMAPPSLNISGDGLSPGQPMQFQGTTFQTYEAHGVSTESSLVVAVSAPLTGTGLLRVILSALLGVIAIGGAIYWLIYERRKAAPVSGSPLQGAEQQALLAQIAGLDASYKARKIKRVEYELRRAELKAELAEKLNA
jgi:mono/diheme cytochrome c family protein